MPVVMDGSILSVIASADTLDECSIMAVQQLHNILVQNGWNPAEAGYLLSLRANLVVCQIVDPKKTVRAELPVSLLKPQV